MEHHMSTMEDFLARAIDPREFDQPAFQRDPFPLYKRLRDHHPIYHDRFHNRWALSRYWETATRSLTVDDTSISDRPASAATRAPMCTAMP